MKFKEPETLYPRSSDQYILTRLLDEHAYLISRGVRNIALVHGIGNEVLTTEVCDNWWASARPYSQNRTGEDVGFALIVHPPRGVLRYMGDRPNDIILFNSTILSKQTISNFIDVVLSKPGSSLNNADRCKKIGLALGYREDLVEIFYELTLTDAWPKAF